LRAEVHYREQCIRELDRERAALLREDTVRDARRHTSELYTQAQAAKLDLVREAYLTAEGLEHTEFRPAAWWLFVLDPGGAWFREVREQARAYLEPLSCCAPQPHEDGR
jgi:hypothetical protein